MRGGRLATIVLLVVAGVTSQAVAQPLAPVGPPPASIDSSPTPATAPTRMVDQPPLLGAPITVTGEPVETQPVSTPTPSTVVPVQELKSTPIPPPGRAARLGAPTAVGQVVSANVPVVPAAQVETTIRQAGATSGPQLADPVSDFLGRRSGFTTRSLRKDDSTSRPSWKFGEELDNILGKRSEWFKSDHAFDGFISPVTNPFLFEDPRSLTEVRPIFLYQAIPGIEPDFRGGHTDFFGLQGRVAITDRLSFVINKLGGITLSPGGDSVISGSTGFSELWFGPKYTFIRDEQAGRLLAGGLQFQAPVGTPSVFQSTGGLSLVPYVSYAESFFRDWRVGGLNVLASSGYSFATSSHRSDYLYLSGHVDLDVLSWHHIYPLVEANYVMYTSNGSANPIGVEGRDLYNFGGQARGQGMLTGAIGARFKVNENIQFGAAFEGPIAGPRDIFDYRFTLDMIFRY